MLHPIINGVIAIVGYFVADKIVKSETGKHIHQHVFGWWCELRESIAGWLRNNTHLKICRISLEVLGAFDAFAVLTKRNADRITLAIRGTDKQAKRYEITTREVSREEALAQFPQLRQNRELIIQELYS